MLQKNHTKAPIIALIDAVWMRDFALLLGALDYIMAPIIESELLIRIESCLNFYDTENIPGKIQPILSQSGQQHHEFYGAKKNYYDEVELIQKTCQFLLKDLSLNHSFKDLAYKMATNHNKLALASKNILGMGIHHWLMEERMKEAGRLCITTDLSIQEIGYRVGYSTPDSFAAAFKSYFKLSPRQYRKNERM
ncbi:hypothetical protein AB835_12840 [Candidatus Endobugula sertula]|uniref:HTH araC/xylS-type domain-containing protein n=1 Tax=Candidatus Endobugula sertula TaxID=62101 RepID=A0A1D2QM85_9GAMM|nr:hypothetical protein AB835_12840 [Candidatus Endobugula sertula]